MINHMLRRVKEVDASDPELCEFYNGCPDFQKGKCYDHRFVPQEVHRSSLDNGRARMLTECKSYRPRGREYSP